MANDSRSTLLVGQSGGATAVINASLAGVVRAAQQSGAFGRVLGLRHGIEGLVRGDLIDLTAQPDGTLDAIRRTPSAALGTGRYKVRDEDLDRTVAAMRELGVTAFIYIGGNDSADTAWRIGEHARAAGHDLRVISVPKTIDNDLPETDFCPGYPSIAQYIGNAVRDATYDTIASPQLYPVKFVEVMGRDAGWVAAAGALGFGPEECDLLPVLLLPERKPPTVDDVLDLIRADVVRRGFSVVVLPETMRTATGAHFGGEEPEYIDGFGHPYFPSTGAAMTRLTTQRLQLRARYDKPGTAARMSISQASAVDLAAAEHLGAAAVQALVEGASGQMVALQEGSAGREVRLVPQQQIANQVRQLDDAFIGDDGLSITDAYRAYMRPLVNADAFPPYGRLTAPV